MPLDLMANNIQYRLAEPAARSYLQRVLDKTSVTDPQLPLAPRPPFYTSHASSLIQRTLARWPVRFRQFSSSCSAVKAGIPRLSE